MPDDLPAHPSIEQLKKQAKDILRAFARKDPSVIDRFRSIRRYASLSEEDLFMSPVKLRDAQFAVALRYGFRSWRHLSDHCIQNCRENAMNETVTQDFNETKKLPHRAIQKILREIDHRDLARALLGADAETRDRIFVNMSSRAEALTREEMSAQDDLDEDAISAAMAKLLAIKKKLADAGEISDGKTSLDDDVPPAKPIKNIEGRVSGALDPEELKRFFFELAAKSRSHGLLSIESDVAGIADPIARKGLELVVDGTDPDIVKSIMRNMLEKEIRFIQTKYEAVIEALLGIQQGDTPLILKQVMESRLS